jgi:hypothetical protein
MGFNTIRGNHWEISLNEFAETANIDLIEKVESDPFYYKIFKL